MKLTAHITRKQIALLLGDNISPRYIKKNERKLGLLSAKVAAHPQPALYRTEQVVRILEARGFSVGHLG